MHSIHRNITRQIHLRDVAIGGGAPVSVQTMCNTDTCDVVATISQISRCMELGCDIVRLAIPSAEAAEAIPAIRRGVPNAPLVADIHFDWRLAIDAIKGGIDGIRINPGNIGSRDRIRAVVKAANERNIPIRIGVNGGSLESPILEKYGSATPEALVESALMHVRLLEDEGCTAMKISVKASDVARTLAAYRLLSEKTQWPLHLGLTEAGTFLAGTVRSCVALGTLLEEGIGDTIRVSLTDSPEQEVRVGVELLRACALRAPGAAVTSCPTCGRTKVDVAKVAHSVEDALELFYRENPLSPRLHIAVMGCMVNGPGEARGADIAVAGGDGRFALYCNGTFVKSIPEADASTEIISMIRSWQNYSAGK